MAGWHESHEKKALGVSYKGTLSTFSQLYKWAMSQSTSWGGECPSADAQSTSQIHSGRAENLSSWELSQSKHLPLFFHTAPQMLLFSEAWLFSLWRTLLMFILTWFHLIKFLPWSRGRSRTVGRRLGLYYTCYLPKCGSLHFHVLQIALSSMWTLP